MNVELLRRVQEHILSYPNHFDMSAFSDAANGNLRATAGEFVQHAEACGTTCCIAGWAALLAAEPDAEIDVQQGTVVDPSGRKVYIEFAAAEALNIKCGGDAWGSLVHIEQWPESFYEDYQAAVEQRDCAEAARVAARRIDYFIENEGL